MKKYSYPLFSFLFYGALLQVLLSCDMINPSTTLPELITMEISDITCSTAVFRGEIVTDGGAVINDQGFCLDTISNPTLDNRVIVCKTKSFSVTLKDLFSNTMYYVRAYARNKVGVSYGEERAFTTDYGVPAVLTIPVTSLTESGAQSGGHIISDGGSIIISRGICWAPSNWSTPTVDYQKTIDSGDGILFTSKLSGLLNNTEYRLRAYATNDSGTGYGNEIIIKTKIGVPEVRTSAITATTTTSVVCGGNIKRDNGSNVFARGICWSTTPDFKVDEHITVNGSGIGKYATTISGLSVNTIYYYRAYATNSVGSGYGDIANFTLLSTGGYTVADIDGNVYHAITIGSQLWMAENLKTTRYNDGTPIPLVKDSVAWTKLTSPAYCYYDNNEIYLMTFGALYNGFTIETSNLCPTCWHPATADNWFNLINFIESEGYGDSTAIVLKSTNGWNNEGNGTDYFSFAALPGGGRGINGQFTDIGDYARWWGRFSRNFYISPDAKTIYSWQMGGNLSGFSVRCMRDE